MHRLASHPGILKRLKRAQGHLASVIGMIEAGRPCAELAQQLQAVESAIANLEEPACGAHYQAYGPVELGFVTGLVAQAALDGLLGKVGRSAHRIYAACRSLLDDAGGAWSSDFAEAYPGRGDGGFIVERDWPASVCPNCARAAAA